MIKRRTITNMVLAAQKEGATHLFVARDQLDPDRLYGVRVMPGEDPREIHDHSDDWLQECYVLNDESVPVHLQLAERRAWHMGPQDSATEPAGPSAPELVALEAVVAEYRQVRAFTFSPANHPPRYDRFEDARRRLVEAARAAYDEGVLTPFQIRRTTGYSRAQVAVGRTSGAQPVPCRLVGSRPLPRQPAGLPGRAASGDLVQLVDLGPAEGPTLEQEPHQ